RPRRDGGRMTTQATDEATAAAAQAPRALPREGITVVDFTQVFMGPSCTQLLGDFGADVIKVERPGRGDTSRNSLPDRDGQDNPVFLSINRNKRGMSIDTKSDEGRAVMRDLIT